MKTYFGLFFLLVFSRGIFAQDEGHIDSLKALLLTAKTDSARVELLNKLSYNLGASDNDQAMAYGRQAVSISQKIGYKKGLGHAFNNLGIFFDQQGESDSALSYYALALDLSRKIKNIYLEASTLGNIGYIAFSQGNYKKALDFTLKGLAILDTGTNYIPTANAMEHVAMIYTELKDYPKAIRYHRAALKIFAEQQSQGGMANVYCNLALDYYPAYKDSMIYYLKKAEAVFFKQQHHWGLGHVYNNIGGVYMETKDYDRALLYLQKARKERAIVGDDRGMCSTHISLGMAWLWKGAVARAKSHVDTAINLALTKDEENLSEAYKAYAMVYAKQGLIDSVNKYFDKESEIKDTTFSREMNKAIVDIQTRYDTEKKDLELAKNKSELLLKEEEAKQKNTIIFSIIAVSLLLGIAGFAFYQRKQIKLKAESNARIAAERESKAKAIIEAEEKERIRIATDLHDGVGQILSAAKLNLSSLENKLKLASSSEEMAFKNALDLVNDSVKEVRAVSHNMMPNTLLKLGLGSAVKEFITKLQTTPNLKVKLEIVGLDTRLEQEKETVLYRVIQEVVSNIIKHAGATELMLQLVRHEKELSIMIVDNGVGFDTSKINDFEGIGLKNILSRVEFINGTVHFDSARNRGTTVVIEVAI